MAMAQRELFTESAGQLRLDMLTLHNFKGIKDFTLDASGRNVSVFGDNATGKTTLFDAFAWLLFGKDSTGATDFELQPLDAAGQPIHNLETSVEGVFTIGGKTISLKKVYSERWTKKRGSVSPEFSGHTTVSFIDGVPVQKKDYDAAVSEIAREDIFKLLTSPSYFNEQLHWQDRRKILLEVCGDLTDAQVIAADPKLDRLPEILKGRRLDDHRKVITARRAEINKELEKIPVRIDEAERSLPCLTGLNEKALMADLDALREKEKAKRAELARIENGGEAAELQKQLRVIEGDLLRIENAANAQANETVAQKRRVLNGLMSQANDLQFKIQDNTRRCEAIDRDLQSLNGKMAALRDAWYEENSREFAFEQSSTCPTCGQTLPEEQLTAAREKALADFNRTKAERLEQITSGGKEKKAESDRLMAEYEQHLKESEALRADLEAKEARIKAMEEEIGNIKPGSPSDNPDYEKKLDEKTQLEAQIRDLQTSNRQAVETARKELDEATKATNAPMEWLANLRQGQATEARIEELKAQEKTLAAEFEKLEGELFLSEEFVRSKVRLLEERINSRFKLARFKMFNQLVNGGIEECCETLYAGVPYGVGLNNAARVNVGLDVVNVLSEHYGFAAPIFVDNAEAVTELIPTQGQMIRLVVSEPDKKLRVEVQ